MPYRPIRAGDIAPSGRLLADCPWHSVYRQLLALVREESPDAIAFLAVDECLAALDIHLPLGADEERRRQTVYRMNLVVAQFNLPEPPRTLDELKFRVTAGSDRVGAAMERVRKAMAPFAPTGN